jgi:hypothetical protein
VESYATLAEARQRLRERSESERARFLVTYGADKCRLRNYNLVCDSTRATPDEIVDQIAAAFHGTLAPETVRSAPPLLLVDPRRIYPTQESQALRDEDPEFVASIGRAGGSDRCLRQAPLDIRLSTALGCYRTVEGLVPLPVAFGKGRFNGSIGRLLQRRVKGPAERATSDDTGKQQWRIDPPATSHLASWRCSRHVRDGVRLQRLGKRVRESAPPRRGRYSYGTHRRTFTSARHAAAGRAGPGSQTRLGSCRRNVVILGRQVVGEAARAT